MINCKREERETRRTAQKRAWNGLLKANIDQHGGGSSVNHLSFCQKRLHLDTTVSCGMSLYLSPMVYLSSPPMNVAEEDTTHDVRPTRTTAINGAPEAQIAHLEGKSCIL